MKASVILLSILFLIGCSSPEACYECGSWSAETHQEGAPDSLVLTRGNYFKFYYLAAGVPFDSITGKYQLDTVSKTFSTSNYEAKNVFSIVALKEHRFEFTDSSQHTFVFVRDK